VTAVIEMNWANPHAGFIRVMENGKPVKVVARNGRRECSHPARMEENGPARGNGLKVDAWQARNGSNTGNVSSITFEDGRRLFAGSSNEQAKDK